MITAFVRDDATSFAVQRHRTWLTERYSGWIGRIGPALRYFDIQQAPGLFYT